MLANGDWVMPSFNGEPRLQKTPLSYWLVAMTAKVTGKVDEFTARLPSAISAILSVAVIIYFISKWLSLRVALLAASVWVTSLGYIRYSQNARPEMLMTFFTTLCFLSFYTAIESSEKKQRVRYMLIFWFSFGIANLAKGPAPIPMVLFPLFCYVMIFRKWKMIPKLLPVLGPIIFLAIILPWPLAIAYRVNWDLTLWKHEFFDRFFGDYASGSKPIYYYLPTMFILMVPWVALLPGALAAPFFKVWQDKLKVMRFLLTWFVAGLIFITIAGGKRQHYILPFMPAVAILVGIILNDMIFERKAHTAKQAKDFLRWHLVAMFIASIAVIIYALKENKELLTAAIVAAGTMILFTIAIAMLFKQNKPRAAMVTVFAAIIVLIMIGHLGFINPLNYNEPSRRFTTVVADKVPADDELVGYKFVTGRFVQYSGRVVRQIASEVEASELYEKGYWIVAFAEDVELLQSKGFDVAYFNENAERHRSNIVAGALFHKTTTD